MKRMADAATVLLDAAAMGASLYLRKAFSLFVRHHSGWRERVIQACRLAAHSLHSITPQSMEITA